MEEKLMETGPATEQLIVVKQLPVIEERLREKAEEIQERTRFACSMVCTQDTLIAVKKIRADLNKEFSQYEEARKDVKRQVMAPYDSFEATYKECITVPYSDADKKLKAMVESVEYHLRDEKEKELRRYYREHLVAAGLNPSEWAFERTGISIILSRSEKSYRSEIKKWVEARAEDIASIRTMPDADEIIAAEPLPRLTNVDFADTSVDVSVVPPQAVITTAVEHSITTAKRIDNTFFIRNTPFL